MSIASSESQHDAHPGIVSADNPSPICARTPLSIIGGGMAAYGLCERLVRKRTLDQYQVSIFGEEPTVAYDRVNLSKLFGTCTADDLQLASQHWYDSNGITFHTGRRIAEIDRDARQLIDHTGRRTDYETLVIATGSRARVPPIPGVETPGVFVYRTIADLTSIKQYVGRRNAKVGAVIGGGLLGLEAAKVLMDLGLKTSVIEMAPGLMPRQLDAQAATMLRGQIESIGVDVHLVRRTESISHEADGRVTVNFANSSPMSVDILIIAAGVVPNDELARECGLETGPRGGVVVDERLQTSDPSIYAMGECVSFREHVYGLVSPCYRMADILADRLGSGDSVFRGADESAELKLLGVNVAVLGQAIGESPAGTTLTQHDADGYRKLIINRGRVIGAACVGDWDELPQIRHAVHKQQRLWPWHRLRFSRTGSPWAPGGMIPVTDWPDESIICSCREVTKQTLDQLMRRGITDPEQLSEASGASKACGSCRSLVCELAGGVSPRVDAPVANAMKIASVVGMVLVLLLLVLPPIPLAESVQSAWRQFDLLWRSDVARQITGYSLLTLLLLAMVFSLRKRTGWIPWGSYGLWRSIHGVLGALLLVAVAVHTGLHLGENLNLVLSTTFIATAALGTLAGLLSSLEGGARGKTAMMIRRWRPRLTRVHLWLFWPVPVLIALHVFSFYWFDD